MLISFLVFLKSISIPIVMILSFVGWNYYTKRKMVPVQYLPTSLNNMVSYIVKKIAKAQSDKDLKACNNLILKMEILYHDDPDVNSEAKELRKILSEHVFTMLTEKSLKGQL